jgi:acyl-CoA hydrolase/GNAT superfamily N-acetyltransferase
MAFPGEAAFVHSPDLDRLTYPPASPFKTRRAGRARDIISSVGLLSRPNVREVAPPPASRKELERFHLPGYLDELIRSAESGRASPAGIEMGLGTPDCPVFPDMYDYPALATGATMTAARLVMEGAARSAFNPSGGFHHAGPARAAGFCYMNDVALACLLLADAGRRVLFLDLDVHHCDGVQNAFYRSSRVMTVSLHESGRALFPGTGFEDEIGEGAGEDGMKDQAPAYDNDWMRTYADMLVSPADAIAKIHGGERIFVGTGCAQPVVLLRALAARAQFLPDTEIVNLLALGDTPYVDQACAASFRVNSLFISERVRPLIQEGLGDYTPIFLSDIPRLFESGRLPLDVALISVAPPDGRGMCSLGVSVDIVRSAAENAGLIIAQVNSKMPRTLGESMIHVHDIDYMVAGDEELPEIPQSRPSDDIRRIGEYIAALVDDGSTVEFGIGQIPQAVMEFLKGKKDLGIHTEMFTDSLIDMIECGAVTGRYKTLDRNRVVASFCLGTKRLYDYIHDNPVFSFHPTEYVNDPFVIAQQHKMVAINVALEVDLTGQVCADSIGTRFYSGIGGQVDFNRGASRSKHGKAIIALPSTAQDDSVSRIVCRLSPGAGVVTTRGDVHYVVTEHGVAYLHGKSVQERVIALISIAHPKFRAQLLEEAIAARFLRPEMADVEGKIVVSPPEIRSRFLLDDGTEINVRPIRPTDMPLTKDLFYALSQETIYYRFMSRAKHITHKEIRDFVFIDHRHDTAIVATLPAAHGEDIIAIGRYYLDPTTNRAEVAFVVHDKWQNRGIGTFLMRYLVSIAKRHGIGGFTAEVLRDNRAMQTVLNKCGCKVTSKLEEGVYSYQLDFE